MKLHQEAKMARLNAYSPYSHYKIGTAVILTNGKVFSGCNIENASYGGTICAERVAILKAISEHPSELIAEICVVSDSEKPWPPCGICRQTIAEFSSSETKIHVANLNGVVKTYKLAELLPEAFTPEFLKK